MRGLGIDRHLFGLYIVAKGMKMDPLPKFFQDKVDTENSRIMKAAAKIHQKVLRSSDLKP